jgi:pimeloyl-ACP methyl ester carboxylesterase
MGTVGMTVPHKAPVVLLHALAVDSRMWAVQRRALCAAGHQVWAPDQRGYGGSPLGAAAPSLDAVADDLARGLDERGVARAVLVGSSMGGYAAMAFLRRHPGRTAALALLGTRAGADDSATAAGRRAFADAVLDPASRPAVLAAALPALVGSTTAARRPAVVAEVRALVEAADPAAVAWCQRAIADRCDSFDVLHATFVPAVVIAGAEDALVPEEETKQMANALPLGEYVVVPDAGHLAALEAPAAVSRALLDLLGRVSW